LRVAEEVHWQEAEAGEIITTTGAGDISPVNDQGHSRE